MQTQPGVSEFEASLIYRATSSTAKATQRNPVSKGWNEECITTPSLYCCFFYKFNIQYLWISWPLFLLKYSSTFPRHHLSLKTNLWFILI